MDIICVDLELSGRAVNVLNDAPESPPKDLSADERWISSSGGGIGTRNYRFSIIDYPEYALLVESPASAGIEGSMLPLDKALQLQLQSKAQAAMARLSD